MKKSWIHWAYLKKEETKIIIFTFGSHLGVIQKSYENYLKIICESSRIHMRIISEPSALVTQPMLQPRPNCTELRSMDYYHQFFCRFRKCKRKVPPPSLLSNDFEKSCFSSAIFSNDFFSKLTFLNSR